ncbi:MAG TPA: VWA domain-containing protein [Syntrophothermus lipocalidus]|nr:VWA domain-containing protein [Syntrophothermus lipocalidus]HOV42545.1 VWA domain-containing protein [Syntrophothermus lipocalidus]
MDWRVLGLFFLYRLKKAWLRLGRKGLQGGRFRPQPPPPRSSPERLDQGSQQKPSNSKGLTGSPVTYRDPSRDGAMQPGLSGGKKSDYLPSSIDFEQTRETGKLVKKLATPISRRRKRGHKRKHLDLKTTIHRSTLQGGTLLKLRWKMKKPAKPRVVLILDTSSSMMKSATIMLQFLYALKKEFRQLEVFIFGNELNYVTPYLHLTFEDLMLRMSQLPQWDFGGTELWRPLAQLKNNFSHLLRSKTTVILLTDCQFYERFFALAPLNNLRRRVKNLYLFNPDPRVKDLTDTHYQETIKNFKTVVDRMFYTETIRDVASALRQILA